MKFRTIHGFPGNAPRRSEEGYYITGKAAGEHTAFAPGGLNNKVGTFTLVEEAEAACNEHYRANVLIREFISTLPLEEPAVYG